MLVLVIIALVSMMGSCAQECAKSLSSDSAELEDRVEKIEIRLDMLDDIGE